MGRKKFSLFIAFVFISVASFFLITRMLVGWGCVKTTGLYATHQYLNRLAYEKLKEHPAFSQSGFPKLPDIQSFAGISIAPTKKGISISGEGPDNPDNTRSSWHYYNPETGEGLAPKHVDLHFQSFRKKLLLAKMKQKDPNLDHFPLARDAAYMAHFIQDLTCAFHVLGTFKFNLNDIKPDNLDVVGPFRVFTEDYFKTVAERCSEDSHKVKGMEHVDWFDPNYYDGPWPATIKMSTHFYYEVAVEDIYRREWALGLVPIPQAYADYSYLSRLWEKGIGVTEFAKAVARETRDRVGTRKKPGPLYFDTKKLVPVDAKLAPPAWVKVPYRDWWRAVRATYTLWRGSFCALISTGIKLEKVKGKQDLYRLKIKLEDKEPDDKPEQIRVKYEMKGDLNSGGSLNMDSMSKADKNGWVTFAPNIRIQNDEFLKNPRSRNGIIRVYIEGRYPNTPDSGKNFRFYDLNDIAHDAVIVPDVMGIGREEATRLLQNTPLNNRETRIEGDIKPRDSGVTFHVVADLTKDMPSNRYQPDTVAQQKPAAGTWAAPGDTVRIFVYGEYKFTTVPNVLFLPEDEASKELKRKPLNVEWVYIQTPSEMEDNLVIAQSPEPETEVIPNSQVIVKVGVYKKPAEKAEFREKDRGFQRQELEKKEKEEISFEESGDFILSSLEIHPSAARLDQGQSLTLTAVAYDMEGKLVTGERLAGLKFQWYSGDPSMASVFGEGHTAQVHALKSGDVAVHCSTSSQVVAALVSIQSTQDTEFKEKREQFEREELFENEPPFEEEDPFQEEISPQVEYDCEALFTEFEAAFRANNIGNAESILRLAGQSGCEYVDRAYQLLKRRYDFLFCKNLYAQFAEAVNSRNMALAEALYGRMLEQNCSSEFLRLAADRLHLDQEMRNRRRQFSREIMQQMQAILDMINRNMGRSRTTPPRRSYPRQQPRFQTSKQTQASLVGTWGFHGQPFCRFVRQGSEYKGYVLGESSELWRDKVAIRVRQVSGNLFKGKMLDFMGKERGGVKKVSRQEWVPVEVTLLRPDLIEFRVTEIGGRKLSMQFSRMR